MSAALDLKAALRDRLDDVLIRYIDGDRDRREVARELAEIDAVLDGLDEEARNLRLAIEDLAGARMTPGEANRANAERRVHLISEANA